MWMNWEVGGAEVTYRYMKAPKYFFCYTVKNIDLLGRDSFGIRVYSIDYPFLALLCCCVDVVYLEYLK